MFESVNLFRDEILPQLKTKISNFKLKYKHEPVTVILNKTYEMSDYNIKELISNEFPYLPRLGLIYSNRVCSECFEIY